MPQSVKILIVEDRSDWQDIVRGTISAEGYSTSTAASYDAAVSALEEKTFDLAIVDPVLDADWRINRDGLNVIHKLSEQQPHTPVMIIAGRLTPDIQTSLQQLCPTAPIFLKDKWHSAEFLNEINKLIKQKWLTPQQIETKTMIVPNSKKRPTPPPNSHAAYPRILFVENEESWQTTIAEILTEHQFFWRMADKATEALSILDVERFNLVILDLKLQKNNLPLRSNEGWLLLDHLAEYHPKVKVIVLSGQATATDVAQLLTQYASVYFIEKQGFTSEALTNLITQATRPPQLTIRTLGQFRISRDDEPLGMISPLKVEAVIKFLLVRRARSDTPVAADELISQLWAVEGEEIGRRQLLPAINAARLIFEPNIEPRDSNFILRSDNGYYFDTNQRVDWDLMTFRQHAERGHRLVAQQAWLDALVELEQCDRIYRGDFLAEEHKNNWANEMRRQITNEFCQLMIDLADTYAALGRYNEAIDVSNRALSKDPLIEGVYRRLMHFHYCLKNKQQALKAYRDCLKLFEELFGEGPAESTRQLHQKIINDEPTECPGLDE